MGIFDKAHRPSTTVICQEPQKQEVSSTASSTLNQLKYFDHIHEYSIIGLQGQGVIIGGASHSASYSGLLTIYPMMFIDLSRDWCACKSLQLTLCVSFKHVFVPQYSLSITDSKNDAKSNHMHSSHGFILYTHIMYTFYAYISREL